MNGSWMLNASLNQPVTPAMSSVVAFAPVLDCATTTESFFAPAGWAAGFAASAGLAAAGTSVGLAAGAAGAAGGAVVGAAAAGFGASVGLAAGALVGAGGWPAHAVTRSTATMIRNALRASR